MRSTALEVTISDCMSVTLAVSGAVHAQLYLDGYRDIPRVGTAFLWQASASVSVAVLIALGGPRWLVWLGSLLSIGSLVAFAASRTVGMFGFIESSLQPAPQTLITVVVELLAVVLGALMILAETSV
jgi:hypothetical protein